MNGQNEFAPVRRPQGALEKAELGALQKAEPGAKGILSGMVADTIALAKKEGRAELRIVVVDDEPCCADVVEIIVQLWSKDITVLKFNDPEEAMQELLRSDPDMLVLDAIMPKLCAHEILRLLTKRGVTYPVLVTSAGFFDDETLSECSGPDMDAKILWKPFTWQQLHGELSRHFGASGNHQRQIRKGAP